MLNQNLGIFERITSPTPPLFRTIRNIALVLTVLGGVIAQLQGQLALPDWILLLGEKAVWVSGLVTAVVSQLTVDYVAKAVEDARDEKTMKGYR